MLRIGVGLIFVAHGAQKLFGAFAGAGLSGTAATFAAQGMPAAYPLALVVALIEFVCGALVLVGAWTRWSALPLILVTAVSVWALHLQHGFFINWRLAPGIGHGSEFHLLLITACACLSMAGAGEFSVDSLLDRQAESTIAGRQRIRGM